MIELATKGIISQEGVCLATKGILGMRGVLRKVLKEVVRLYSKITRMVELRSKLGCRRVVS